MQIVTHVLTSPQSELRADTEEASARRKAARQNIGAVAGIKTESGPIEPDSDGYVQIPEVVDADEDTKGIVMLTDDPTSDAEHTAASPAAIRAALADFGGFQVVTLDPVTKEPDVDSPSPKYIYLTKDEDSHEKDPYTEWIWVVKEAPAESHWDVIGTTSVDLSGYVEKVSSGTTGNVATLTDDGSIEDSTIAGTDVADAVAKKHSHSNQDTLDDITAAYTTAEQTKLSGIATGAQVNTIESISVNDTAVEPDANKNVNIVIPKAVPDPTEVNQMLFSRMGQNGLEWYPVTWEFVQFATIGGQDYPTVKIGNQEWLGYNLDMKFAGLVVGDTSGATTTESRGNYYNNDETTNGWEGKRYGLLYNWIAANYMNSNRATLFPGWHVPTAADIDELATYLGTTAAGTKLKSTSGWLAGNGDGSTEFNGMPVGYYYGTTFSAEGNMTFYWTSESASDTQANYWQLTPGPAVYTGSLDKDIQCSIRLVKDSV
jgi:uncharacterized protein (TIGR02145 family)